MTRRRVLLADDHAQTMQLWRTLLEPEFDVVGTVNDGESLVHADSALLRSSLAAGAYAYVLKVRAADDLVPAVRAALRGELLISPFPHTIDAAGPY